MLGIQSTVMDAIGLLILACSAWALIDAAIRPGPAFEHANKLTKKAWLLILALNGAVQLLFGGFAILAFAGIVAVLVYLLDVRPAVAGATRR